MIDLLDHSMPIAVSWRWDLDGWIVLIGCLAAVSSALLGNFLLLRRMSMLGDAITHAVLPGIAIAFLLTHSRSSVEMFVGAAVVGVLTAFFTEWIRGSGGVDEGASMGVVFTTLFALGLVLIYRSAGNVHLDADCVLKGAIEYAHLNQVELFGQRVPRPAIGLTMVLVVNSVFVILFFKELKISSFDPSFSTTIGYSAKWLHYALMVLVSVTAVACFESVGSILVVAMLVVPAAAAHMLTDQLKSMIIVSVALAIASVLLGHWSAVSIPPWFGYKSTTTSGMIAVCSGLLFVLAAGLGPRHGILIRFARRQLLSLRILSDDIVAMLFRGEELDHTTIQSATLASQLFASRISMKLALLGLRRRGEVLIEGDELRLTEVGRRRGKRLVRSHRLWEQYLLDRAGSKADRIHGQAEQFEHFTDRTLRDELARETDEADLDPHGRPIPKET